MRWTTIVLAALVLTLTGRAFARQDAPVFADDSVAAAEVLGTRDQPRGLVGSLLDTNNLGEAVRVLQSLLDADADRVVATPEDSNLFVSVRRRVHDVLLSSPALLETYRTEENVRAESMLRTGETEAVERSRLLTASGLEACLRLTQRHFESARFDAAWLMLMQLESHPDRRIAAGADSARMALDIAGYMNREEASRTARRWANESGLPAEEVAAREVAVAAPPGASRVSSLPLPVLSDASHLPRTPLRSAPLPWKTEITENDPAGRPIGDEPEQSWVIPSVVGDVVYINDGVSISALDRFTLRRHWVTRPSDEGVEAMAARRDEQTPTIHRGIGRVLEDPTTTTVSGNVVIATTGHALQQRRDGDPRVHALDAVTGAVLWSTDVQFLDAQLSSAIVRGPAIIDSDTVILGVRKFAPTRRLVTSYLVGLNLADGSARWIRLLGSAGSLPIRRGNLTTDGPTLQRGVVYRADELGLVAAVEAGTGRPIWVRRLGGMRMLVGGGLTPAWAYSSPVVVGNSVFVLTPLSGGVVQLDAATGEIRDRRSTDDLGMPNFLLRIGEHLAAIGTDQISFVPHASLGSGTVRLGPSSYGTVMLRGRPVVSGDRLLVPTGEGLSILSAAEPTHEVIVDLDLAGNVVPGDPGDDQPQLLVADAEAVHSFLQWETAERLLQRRIEQDPADATPAMTLADLAFAANRYDRIAPAVDLALAVIARDPASSGAAAARRSLFASLERMVDPDAVDSRASVLPPEHRLRLLNQMERLAESPRDRVQYLLCRASFFETSAATGSAPAAAQAIDSCQRILLDTDLAGVPWNAAAAADVATTRVRKLVSRLGPGIYKVFDEEATRELAALGGSPSSAQILVLARRYPCADITPRLWNQIANAAEARGDRGAAGDALGQSLLAAEVLATSGPASAQQELSDAASRLVNALLAAERPGAALRLVGRLARRNPQLRLTVDGSALDVASLMDRLELQSRSLARHARIGDFNGHARSMTGWTILEPLSERSAGSAIDMVTMFNAAEGRTALFALAPENGALEEVWSRPGNPQLLRLDADGAYFFWHDPQWGRVERVEPSEANGGWISRSTGEAFGPAGLARGEEQLPTPLDGPVDGRDLIFLADAETIVLIERKGRCCALDAKTGTVRWSKSLPVRIAFDAAITGEIVTICGAKELSADRGPEGPVVIRLNTAGGQPAGSPIEPSSGVRWVRAAANRAIIGLEDGIIALNQDGQPAWAINDQAIQKSADAWVFGDTLFILTRSRDLMTADAQIGGNLVGPIENRAKLAGGGLMKAHDLKDHIAFSTRRGVLIYDRSGTLIGTDALTGLNDVLYPQPVSNGFVTVSSELTTLSDGRQAFTVHFLDTPTGKLRASRTVIAHETPSQVTVLDGRLLVTVGYVTLVIDAPAAP